MSATNISNLTSNSGSNARAIGDLTTSAGLELLRVNVLRSLNRGTVTIENAVLNTSISGDVLGSANGIATLGPTGIIPTSQLGATIPVAITTVDNTALGQGALINLTTGTGNVGIGFNAGGAATTSVNNTYVGHRAGQSNDGNFNLFVGYQAGLGATTSTSCTYLGAQSGTSATNAQSCTFVGSGSGFLNTGDFNTLMGHLSGENMTSGTNNAMFGYRTGRQLGNGSGNTFIGSDAGFASAAGTANCTFVGYRAGAGATNADNTFVGAEAGLNATQGGNTAVGRQALNAGLAVNNCTAVGYGALLNYATGNSTIAIGMFSMFNATLGSSNNCMIGDFAGQTLNGSFNVGIGGSCFLSKNGLGDSNVCVGHTGFPTLVSGNRNIGVGARSGDGLTTGDDNIFIGNNTFAGAGNVRCIIMGSTSTVAAGLNDCIFISTNGGGTGSPNSIFLNAGTTSLFGNSTVGFQLSHNMRAPGIVSTDALMYNGFYGAPVTGSYSPLGALSGGGGDASDRLRYLCGTVDAAGALFGPNMGVTTSRLSAGNYQVTFNTGYNILLHFASATVFGSSAAVSAVVPTFTTAFMTVQIRNNAGVSVDSPFFFMAIGQ